MVDFRPLFAPGTSCETRDRGARARAAKKILGPRPDEFLAGYRIPPGPGKSYEFSRRGGRAAGQLPPAGPCLAFKGARWRQRVARMSGSY